MIASSAHEGARAAVELGGTEQGARIVAERTVAGAVGELIDELDVGVSRVADGDTEIFKVVVSGSLRPFGLVPIRIPVSAEASASRPGVTP